MKKLVLVIFIFCFTSTFAQQKQKYININGTSEIILPADQINFAVEIRIVDESIEASKKTNDKVLNELITILKNESISKDDIETSPIRLGKNYKYKEDTRERIQDGFYTEVEVNFTLKDLSKYFELSNKIASNDNFEIQNSSYSISDYEHQHQNAYIKALKAAKVKAEYMTKTLGVKLGEVLEIDENNYNQSYASPFNTVTKVNSESANISGKVTIRRSIRVKFAIN